MNWIDYGILGGIILLVIGITVHLIKEKKQGKGGCGCGCKNCPSAGACQRKTEEKNV